MSYKQTYYFIATCLTISFEKNNKGLEQINMTGINENRILDNLVLNFERSFDFIKSKISSSTPVNTFTTTVDSSRTS